MKMVACGEFVKRQTPESGYSHYEGTWAELEDMVSFHMTYNPSNIVPGYRDGVVLVPLPASYFRSAIVDLNENCKLRANYSPRRPGEDPFIRVSTKAEKQAATHASVVLYRWDVLEENNERETDAEWEIVCIKARVSDEDEPMMPMTMARNFLGMVGGTKGTFTAEDFAYSIVYWNQHAMCFGRPKWYRKIISWYNKLLLAIS